MSAGGGGGTAGDIDAGGDVRKVCLEFGARRWYCCVVEERTAVQPVQPTRVSTAVCLKNVPLRC